MKLKNIIKFLILSATLSNTCLFATQTCRIEWGFFDPLGSKEPNENDALYFRFTCQDDHEGTKNYATRAEYKCFVRPVNTEGEKIAWSEFASKVEEERTKGAPNVPEDDKDNGEDKKFYRISVPSDANSDWSDELFTMSNDQNGFEFHCGSFFIRLDRLGDLYLGGGGERDILLLCKKKDKSNQKGFPCIPFFFDDKTPLVGNTLVIEDANVLGDCKPLLRHSFFINKSTISFDNIIWRGLIVKNEGKIFARNLILDKSTLHNKGQIQWSDNYDLYRNSKAYGNKGTIDNSDASAKRTIKITAKCEARNKTAEGEPGNKTMEGKASDKTAEGKASDDIGWLSWTEAGGKGIEFPEMKTRVTVYVTGEYTGSLCSAIGFFETTDNPGMSDEEANEGTWHFSAVASYHKLTKRPLYVALVDNEGKPRPPVNFDKNSSIYIVHYDDTWGKNRFGK